MNQRKSGPALRIFCLALIAVSFLGMCASAFTIMPVFGIFSSNKIITVGDSYKTTADKILEARAKLSAMQGKKLPRVKDMTELLAIFQKMGVLYDPSASLLYNDLAETGGNLTAKQAADGGAPAPQAAPAETEASTAARDTAAGDYSSTNTQVSGVDEGDILKTDGSYIYTTSENRVAIVKADGGSSKLVSAIDETNYISELYVSGKYLVTVCSEYQDMQVPADGDASIMGSARMMIWRPGKTFTRFNVYDISDKENPLKIRTVRIEGGSLSTRLSNDTVYFVTSKWLYAVPYQGYAESDLLPSYSDTASGGAEKIIPASDIVYYPDSQTASYMLVGAFELGGSGECVPEAYLGTGNTVYMSTDSLYVANQEWSEEGVSTQIFRFAVDGAALPYVSSCEIPGYILNQYSMDEYNGSLRVAVTYEEGNGVYIIDRSSMEITGKIEGLAEDERIQSARFMGDAGYLVTFQNTDPLFVLDLSDPTAPSVKGELKIPGFSQYLHPLTDTVLIGFGRNTQETYTRDESGKETVVGFVDTGMKLSMFDVSDPFNPREIHKLVVGARNSSSEAFYNPRAMMVDIGRGKFGFPANFYGEYDNRGKEITPPWYGCTVVSADPAKGFSVDANLDNMKTDKSDNDYGWGGQQRLCYIGNNLYMLSNGKISVYDYGTYSYISSVPLSK